MTSKPARAGCKTLVDMNDHTETLSRPARTTDRAATPAAPVLISVAEVLLGSAAAGSTVRARRAGGLHTWWVRRT
ncbi:MAG: hypothetical protein WBB00_12060, partial [Mycobacterium sp.]